MTEMLEPKPGESIYDRPAVRRACCSPPSPSEAAEQGVAKLRLFGQERNLLTSAIGRMNLFLHGVENSALPGRYPGQSAFVEGDRLMQFDVSWLIHRIPSNSGIAMLGLPTHGVETSTGRHPKVCGLRLFAHIIKSMKPKWPLCHLVSAWRSVPQRRVGDARKVDSPRCCGVRVRAWTQSFLQLTHGGLRRYLSNGQT